MPISAAFVMCCLSINTVFAYEAPVETGLSEVKGEHVEFLADDPVSFNSWDDKIITDNDGNIYEIGNQNRASCRHNYVSCTFGDHKIYSDGTCITYIYEANKCTKCGNKINEELTGELSYKKCPH